MTQPDSTESPGSPTSTSSAREVAHGTVVSGRGDSGLPQRSRNPFAGWTLRRKLVASMLALFVVITLATSLLTIVSLQRSLEQDLDQQVFSTATRAFRPPPVQNGDDGGGPGIGGDYLLLTVDDNTMIGRNEVYTISGDFTKLSQQQVAALIAAKLSGAPQTIDLGGNLGRYRLVASRVSGGVIISGLPTARLDDSLVQLRLVTLAAGIGGIVLLGVGATYLVRTTMRPLERVAATAARVSRLPLSSGEVSLAERVPWADTDERTEVGKVGSALNELLDHVDKSLSARHASETKLRQFVADASHELRTPLASIRGYAELSRREPEPVPESVRHGLTRIESEANRMGALVEDLLLLARLDAGRPLESKPVDLSMLLIDAISDAQVAGRDHSWRLDLPDEAVEVMGDQARLTQVVVNLLANARVHTPAGTTVTGRVYASLGAAVLEIEDDGPGISPELLPHIFGRFTRGDSARTRTGSSTGLGLSIVQAVMVAHNGTIDVASEPGRTIFMLRLPTETP